jgi:CBS domain-containing protein
MIAADLMTENPRTIRATAPISEALEALQSMEIRHLPVVDDGNNLVGMLSDRDLGPLMRTFTEGEDAQRMIAPLSRRRVAELMSSDVVSLDADVDVREVIETMLDQRVGAVPVLDGEGTVMGIISYVDVLRALEGELEPPEGISERSAHAHDVERRR